ncbi:dipeptidase PepV [Tetragenococcus osmophilus]|uniref:Dipeptidase PepV n=1 Tax=Tetragenococcus osmophilus TaxID=526944 RepID=A0AA37XMN4_9ENTE|nr:dipeptidase PepV [Tetragenococcus osmophilus]AYW47501.1 dipeptidase PepV [Tetragenococcus osmophilus]GMA53108.1 dipeptidase PepV [Alicyclobacillus contaminans]GMA72914.1 dipeptidase PepV [Tetragenococcus osmophilus]
MAIDWQKEVDARKDDILNDLKELLKVKSEREDDKITAELPFGPGPSDALKQMLSYGERDGFTVKNVDNYAGHIEFGQGDETLGIFGHMDVVPAGDDWQTDPYDPVVKDGKLYARGSSDDKGPSMAAYYAMKIIKELDLPLSKKIRFVVGSDEESGWGDMDHYFEKESTPDFGFSPDAEFPIINGEKGNVSIQVHIGVGNEGNYTLESFQGGLRDNMVPTSASAKVKTTTAEQADAMTIAFNEYLGINPISGTSIMEDDTTIIFQVAGKGSHGASPQFGYNAATWLASFLDKYDFAGGAKNFLHVAAAYVHEDFYGEKLGVAFEDPKMGKLTMNAGIFDFDTEKEDAFINLNFRYPQGTSSETLQAGINDTIGAYDVTLVEGGHHMVPHYVPQEDPLVTTLLDVYEEHTGEKGEEQIIGGGTYGRLLKRGVAFGAMFPDSVDTMHQADEFMSLDDLDKATVIYADAIYRLAK